MFLQWRNGKARHQMTSVRDGSALSAFRSWLAAISTSGTSPIIPTSFSSAHPERKQFSGTKIQSAKHYSSRAGACQSRSSAWSAMCVPCGSTNVTTWRSEEHTSELQSHSDLVCRLLLEKKKTSL